MKLTKNSYRHTLNITRVGTRNSRVSKTHYSRKWRENSRNGKHNAWMDERLVWGSMILPAINRHLETLFEVTKLLIAPA